MAIYRFGSCELDSDRHRLRVAGAERRVEPQVFDLLHFLAEKGDAIASRDELIERVWKGRIVTDASISVRINAARKAVGDDGSRQAVIETVPRRGFRLAVGVSLVNASPETAAGPPEAAAAAAARRPVIGIFPFEPLGEALPDYLVRGVAEDLATELSRFRSIEVIAPYSTFRHDFSARDPFAVARSLGITQLVTGSLHGEHILQRINVRLLDVANGNILWSESYEVHGDELFAARDDAVLNIVGALIQGLTEHQAALARRKPTASLSAYECLLRGLQIYKWGVNSIDEARQALFWFDRAIELDDEYARARAWRECCYSAFWSSPPEPSEIDAAARRMRLALSLDENDHEVHRLKGAIHMCSGEHDQGEYHLARSVDLNPNDAHILVKIGLYRSFLARHDDALACVDAAIARNPLHPSWYWQDRGIALFAEGDYEQAIGNLLRSDTENEIACLYLAAANALLDRRAAARAQVDRLRAMNAGVDVDWLKVAYPTRCYQESPVRRRFFEGLARAGL